MFIKVQKKPTAEFLSYAFSACIASRDAISKKQIHDVKYLCSIKHKHLMSGFRKRKFWEIVELKFEKFSFADDLREDLRSIISEKLNRIIYSLRVV